MWALLYFSAHGMQYVLFHSLIKTLFIFFISGSPMGISGLLFTASLDYLHYGYLYCSSSSTVFLWREVERVWTLGSTAWELVWRGRASLHKNWLFVLSFALWVLWAVVYSVIIISISASIYICLSVANMDVYDRLRTSKSASFEACLIYFGIHRIDCTADYLVRDLVQVIELRMKKV